eukprot:CAMPEP_0173082366 /NCGR_PEP_ID=MMETSP1102-20130122/18193_1 /TAXON_ID=49646 /ORGANISM="Geminigera sp., Strain Caron Lab Isolate" /LENGTH=258 /DNA_ID=CAMNT_0013957859 /DNA_START=188 /DNA_END=965 /DNA_ORIENTATION=+
MGNVREQGGSSDRNKKRPRRREREKGIFGAPKRVVKQPVPRPKNDTSLWESIFGKTPDPNARTVDYAHDGVKRAQLKSIERIVEVVGCSEGDASKALESRGWSVHNTIAMLLSAERQHTAPANLEDAYSSAAGGRVMGPGGGGGGEERSVALDVHEPTEDEKSVALGLFISVVPHSTKHDAERCLRENMWNVQEAIKACLVTNPQLPLFDGLACDVPVGVPVDETSGFIPQGGDVWESESVMDGSCFGDVPVGVAIQP